MITRIVKLTIQPDRLPDFLQLFREVKDTISAFDGCHRVELLQDIRHPHIFFTYSIWENEHFLDLYRFSDFFKKTWQRTKPLFQQKAEAWSVRLIERAVSKEF